MLSELDYVAAKLAGVSAEIKLLDEVARGAYQLANFDAHEIERSKVLVEQFRDLQIGLAEASLLVLAERTSTADLLTLDERRFRVLPGPGGRPFHILPADQ